LKLRSFAVFSIASLAGTLAFAQTEPAVQSSQGFDALQRGAAVMQAAPGSPVAGNVAFDASSPSAPPAPVAGGDDQPIVTTKPRGSDTGAGDNAGDDDSEIGRMIRKVLKDPAVTKALDDVRKDQSEKFAKETVDHVMADPRIKKITEGPSKTKSIIVSSGIGGAGALLAGIGFAVGLPALGFVGLGVLGAGLVGLLLAWL
jgi:hypothetical protein